MKIPGYPFVVGPGGEVVNVQDISIGEYQEAYMGQLAWTNKRLEWLIDILLSDPEYSPVIVIQGDHGETSGQTARLVSGQTVELDLVESLRARYGIMNAYHLPDGGDALLYPSITPINTFRVIFNYYLGADLELLEDSSYKDSKLDSTDLKDLLAGGIED